MCSYDYHVTPTLFLSVSPSKESAVVKQKLSQEEEAKFKVKFSPNIVGFIWNTLIQR